MMLDLEAVKARLLIALDEPHTPREARDDIGSARTAYCTCEVGNWRREIRAATSTASTRERPQPPLKF